VVPQLASQYALPELLLQVDLLLRINGELNHQLRNMREYVETVNRQVPAEYRRAELGLSVLAMIENLR
jgi:hypothetical protein